MQTDYDDKKKLFIYIKHYLSDETTTLKCFAQRTRRIYWWLFDCDMIRNVKKIEKYFCWVNFRFFFCFSKGKYLFFLSPFLPSSLRRLFYIDLNDSSFTLEYSNLSISKFSNNFIKSPTFNLCLVNTLLATHIMRQLY